jgi:hypothetical protein
MALAGVKKFITFFIKQPYPFFSVFALVISTEGSKMDYGLGYLKNGKGSGRSVYVGVDYTFQDSKSSASFFTMASGRQQEKLLPT